MREAEIRPEHLMAEQRIAVNVDTIWLRLHYDQFVEVSCPACDGDGQFRFCSESKFDVEECSDCGTLYQNPRPTPELLTEYYACSRNSYYWRRYIFPATELMRREHIFVPRLKRLTSLLDGSCFRLVDFGAGFGTFCEIASESGKFGVVYAVEQSPEMAVICKSKAKCVLSGLDKLEHKANVITAFEVIEHLFSPREFLLKCAKHLEQDGLVVLTTPNVQGFDVTVLGEESSTFSVEHLNYFHPQSLKLLVESCGFKILELTTPGELDTELVRKAVLAETLDVSDRPFLERLLVHDWDRLGSKFQQFLVDNMLSSHTWLVARAT